MTNIRVLVADDEPEVRDAYRQIWSDPSTEAASADFRSLQKRLFAKPELPPTRAPSAPRTCVRPSFCDGAEAAVAAVRASLADGDPYAVAFLDMRMPPGPDGIWAAARIRELDPAIEIVVCTAYSDVDPGDVGGLVPPETKLSYLQKPFHPHEIRQMTISLASKWRAEQRIAQLANFDALTGLPNREQSRQQLTAALTAAGRDHRVAVLYLDLDNFKKVNDSLGQKAGDELLCGVAARLRLAMIPGADHQVARLGGDEFAVVLSNAGGADAAAALATQVIADLQAPMQLASSSVVVTPSVGIAMYPEDGADADSLLRSANLAMYAAKRRGTGQLAFFQTAMDKAAQQRFNLEANLRGALERHEFVLNYQPQFDVSTGSVSGMEALLRWNHAQLGNVSPADFIPIAEESGLILPIGEWVLREACRQAKSWQDEGLPLARMAVNVSGRQFVLQSFPATVAAILKETGLPPSMLELEITETVVVNDEAWAQTALRQLKGLGVQLSIDDFGTGYSSFGRLRHFAVDRLKIDRSFIARLIDNSDDRAIAAAIIAMSRSLRINVTAEGVESFPQLMFLQEHQCQEAQGFLFSRALSADEAQALLRRAAETAGASRTQRLRSLIV